MGEHWREVTANAIPQQQDVAVMFGRILQVTPLQICSDASAKQLPYTRRSFNTACDMQSCIQQALPLAAEGQRAILPCLTCVVSHFG